MSRLFQFVSEIAGRRRSRPRPETMSAAPMNDSDPLFSYLRVLEEARKRRGRLFTRF
jgi:hypothetical protein